MTRYLHLEKKKTNIITGEFTQCIPHISTQSNQIVKCLLTATVYICLHTHWLMFIYAYFRSFFWSCREKNCNRFNGFERYFNFEKLELTEKPVKQGIHIGTLNPGRSCPKPACISKMLAIYLIWIFQKQTLQVLSPLSREQMSSTCD